MPQRKPEVTRRTAAGIPYELTRKKVKRAIIENAGPSTEAGAIVFSLPASEVAGFGMFEDTSGEEK